MSIIPRYLGAGLAVAALVTLTACAPTTPASTSSPSADSTTAAPPSAAPTSTPTPTPTAADVAPPVARAPLACGDLAPDAQLTSTLGVTMSPVDVFGLGYIDDYATTQEGALRCDWQGPGKNGNYPIYGIVIMPDTTKWFNSYLKYLKSGSTITSPFGPNSYLNCDSAPKELRCELDLLHNGTWLSATGFTSKSPTSLTNAQILARFKPLLQTAVSALTGVTVVEPAWSNPAATSVSYSTDLAVSMTKLSTAVGFHVEDDVLSPDIIAHGPADAVDHPVRFRSVGCGGNSKTTGAYSFDIEVLPAGSWAWAQINAAAAGQPNYVPITGLGTQAISYTVPKTKNSPETTVVQGLVGANLYSIAVTGSKNPKSDPLDAAKKAAGVAVAQMS